MADAGLPVLPGETRTVKIKCFEHEENTPSLVVSPSKQLFNCFGAGCNVGGDVLAFTMQFYRLDFNDAVQILVDSYSPSVADLVVEKTSEERQLDRYQDINATVADLLHRQLAHQSNALGVLFDKQISPQTLAQFKVGYSKNAHSIVNYLKSQGVQDVDVQQLQFTRDDIFTNRIIYPLFDLYGRITYFYGRSVGQAATKYLGMSRVHNEVPHPLFDRSVPYGLHVARSKVSKAQGKLIIVEGHNDVLGLHSHGIDNSIACMSSAPSERQYAMLHDLHIYNIIMCPDGDAAGYRTMESINKNRALHQQVKIMQVPDGSDPDEFVAVQGADAFRKLVMEAVYPIELIIRYVAEKYNNAGPTDKLDMAADAMRYMAGLSGFEREFALGEIAGVTGVDRSTIEETVSSMDEGPMVDVELERKIIGEVILDKARAVHAASALSPEDFTSAKHSSMWRALSSMVHDDLETFSREMFIAYAIDKEYIAEKDAPLVPTLQLGSAYSLDYAMDKLADLTLRRRLVKSATRLLVDSKAKKADVHEVLNGHLVQLATAGSSRTEVTTAQQQIKTTMELIHERMGAPGMPGVDIGHHWKKLMHCLLGFQKGHMLAVAGIMKSGKTTLVQNWNLQQLINVGEPTLWVNLEMNESDLVMRNLSIMSGVDNSRMKVGNISMEEKDAIDKSAVVYNGFNLHVANMAGCNVFDLVNHIRRYVYASGVRLVFIDYLQLIRIDRVRGKSALWEEQNDVVSAVRDVTSKLGITTIVISQLNRGAMAEGSSSGQHIAGTIKLLQDSDCYMGIRKKRKEELEEQPHSNSALQIEFNRHGPQGLEIDLQFKYGSMQIREA